VSLHPCGTRRDDREGAIARRGRSSRWMLRILLRDSYFKKAPPKTAGREEYGEEMIEHLVNTRLPFEDLIATATAFTASSIADGLRRHVMPKIKIDEMFVSGGGAHNSTLIDMLASELPEIPVRGISELGINGDAKEALAFAVLAHETWAGEPSNLPSATGARAPVILGKISPGPGRQR
jgi:anhydro-N-acetylmuramic acid kinase